MMTKKILRLAGGMAMLLALVIPRSDGQTAPRPTADLRPLADRVGIYHWGGVKAKGVAAGVDDIVSLNATVARITLSPRMSIDYNMGPDCIAGFTLAGALADEDVRRAIANPAIRVFIISAYDGASFTDCHTHTYLSPEFYSQANTAKVIAEYSDFVYQLYSLFRGSGKEFILTNWEGDNAIYCGSAFSFGYYEGFRKSCLDAYPTAYAGNRTPAESIEGMVLWFQARYLGASRGIERAHSQGLEGVQVYSAPEFSAIHMLRDFGFASVLWDVIPRVRFDYVSYSSYESLSNGGSALSSDLDLIRSVAGTDRIIIGEIGFQRSSSGGRLVPWTIFAINAALDWGVAYIVQWNLYDQLSTSDFGLYDVDGNMTDMGLFYKQAFKRNTDSARKVVGFGTN